MKDRLSFRTGEVSPFSQILLESVEDYSSTTRYAIDHLSRADHPVLMIAHKSGVTLFDPINAVCQLAYGPEETRADIPQVPWAFRQKFPPAETMRALPAQDVAQTETGFSQTVSLARPPADALWDTIGAGIDREDTPPVQEAQTFSPPPPAAPKAPTPSVEPKPIEVASAAPRRRLNSNMLETFGAGLDREPPTEEQIAEARERIAARIAASHSPKPEAARSPATSLPTLNEDIP